MEEEELKKAVFNIDENSQNDSLESISDDSDLGNSDNDEPLNNNGVCSSKMNKMIRDWEDYMSGQRTEQPSSSSSAWSGNNNNNSMADIEGIISKETSIYTHPNSQNALLGPEDLDVNLDLVNIDIDPNNIDLDGDLNLNTGIGDGDLDSDMKMDDLPDFIPTSDRKLIYPLYTDDIPYVRPKKYFGYEPSCTVTSSALGEIYENVDIFKDDQIKALTAEITGQCTIQPIGLPPDIVKSDTPPIKKASTEKSAPAPMKSIDGFLVPAPVKKRRIKVKDPASLLPKPSPPQFPPQLPPQLPPPVPSSDPWATEIIPIPLKPQQEGQNRTQGYKRKASQKNTSVIKQILNGPPNNGEEPEEPTQGIRDYHRDASHLLSTIRLAPNPQRYVEPYVPQYLDPFRQRNVEPYRPRDVEPYRSRNIDPYRQRNVEPYRPRNVEPYRPRIEPAYDPANFGFPSTSYGFSPATSEGFNNAASQAFYNPLAGFDHNPYNPTQYSIFGNYPQPSENNNKRKAPSKSSGIIKYADGCVVRSPFDLPRASNEPPVPTFNYFSEPYDKIIKRGNKVVETSAYSDQQKYPDKDHYKKGKDPKK